MTYLRSGRPRPPLNVSVYRSHFSLDLRGFAARALLRLAGENEKDVLGNAMHHRRHNGLDLVHQPRDRLVRKLDILISASVARVRKVAEAVLP